MSLSSTYEKRKEAIKKGSKLANFLIKVRNTVSGIVRDLVGMPLTQLTNIFPPLKALFAITSEVIDLIEPNKEGPVITKVKAAIAISVALAVLITRFIYVLSPIPDLINLGGIVINTMKEMFFWHKASEDLKTLMKDPNAKPQAITEAQTVNNAYRKKVAYGVGATIAVGLALVANFFTGGTASKIISCASYIVNVVLLGFGVNDIVNGIKAERAKKEAQKAIQHKKAEQTDEATPAANTVAPSSDKNMKALMQKNPPKGEMPKSVIKEETAQATAEATTDAVVDKVPVLVLAAATAANSQELRIR